MFKCHFCVNVISTTGSPSSILNKWSSGYEGSRYALGWNFLKKKKEVTLEGTRFFCMQSWRFEKVGDSRTVLDFPKWKQWLLLVEDYQTKKQGIYFFHVGFLVLFMCTYFVSKGCINIALLKIDCKIIWMQDYKRFSSPKAYTTHKKLNFNAI